MLKRAFWFTTGATAGFGGAMWVRRQVLQAVHRYTPERVQADVTSSVRRLGTDLRAAVTTGRAAMADREAELRSELRPGAGPALIPVARATDPGRSVSETARGARRAAGKRRIRGAPLG
jgi:hypothetical protein